MASITHHNPNLRSGNKGTQFEEELLYTMNEYNKGKDNIVCYLERSEVPKIMSKGRIIYTEKKGFDLIGGVRTDIINVRMKLPEPLTVSNEELQNLNLDKRDKMLREGISEETTNIMIQLCIEAKNIDDALPILDDSVSFNSKGKKKNKGHGVKSHQLKALCELQKSGAICMILWKTRSKHDLGAVKVYKLDPLMVMNQVGMGKSITIEKHESLLTEVHPYGLAWDFLNLLKRN